MSGFESGMDRRFRVATVARIPIYITLWFILLMGFFALEAITRRDLILLLWMILLTVFVFLHELGHAFMARRFGSQIRAITMHLFGGLMESAGLHTRRERILISLAGPAVNLAFALPAGALWLLQPPLGALGSWLVFAVLVINGGLLVFNLLPIYPMDGGQVARYTLSRYFDPVRAATLSAILSLVVVAAFLVASALLGFGMWSFLIVGMLAVINVIELVNLRRMRRLQGRASPSLWGGLSGWLRHKLKRRKTDLREIERILNRAELLTFEALTPDERRALIRHRSELEFRIQREGIDSLSAREQELYYRHHEAQRGRIVQ